MARWKLSTKDSAATHTFMSKDDVRINVIEHFSFGSVFLETENDAVPDVDLNNKDGVNTYLIPDTEWELDEFSDSHQVEVVAVEGKISKKELKELKEKFIEDGIYGLEDDDWFDEGECEWWMYGPLQLEDEDGNIIAQGKPSKDEE